MKITNETKRTFAKSIEEAIEFLNDDGSKMNNPCICAETGGEWRKEITFCFCPLEQVEDGDVLWTLVDPDSFGDYDAEADPKDEADAIAANMEDDAILSIVDQMDWDQQ